MIQESLAGAWKLRPEFIDVGPERFNEVLSRPEGPFELLRSKEGGAALRPFPQRKGFLKALPPAKGFS